MTDGKEAPSEPSPLELEEKAREVLLRKLSLRPHSRAELEQALEAKGVAPDLTEHLLDRFTEVNLVNDEDFARQWVASRQRTRGSSRRALREELRRKGIDRDLIDDATSAVSSEDELEAALELARKKMRTLASLEPPVQRRRLAGALGRRGYGYEVVERVLREVLVEGHD